MKVFKFFFDLSYELAIMDLANALNDTFTETELLTQYREDANDRNICYFIGTDEQVLKFNDMVDFFISYNNGVIDGLLEDGSDPYSEGYKKINKDEFFKIEDITDDFFLNPDKYLNVIYDSEFVNNIMQIHYVNYTSVDDILDKISEHGIDSLNEIDKIILE